MCARVPAMALACVVEKDARVIVEKKLGDEKTSLNFMINQFSAHLFNVRAYGPMDKALAYGVRDCRFESC